MNTEIARRALFLGLCGAGMLLLQSCDSVSAKTESKIDLAAEPMPFVLPEIKALTVLPGAPVLLAPIQQTLDLRRAFFAGDFSRIDAALLKFHEDYLAGRSDDFPAVQVIAGIQDTQLAGVNACANWLRTMPTSYSAHRVCGAMWKNAAWKARSTSFSKDVSAARFALMHERLQRSNQLLEKALTLHPKPLQALTMLADNHYLDGNGEQAEQYLQRAEQINPQHLPIHYKRLDYARPEWGGSTELVQAAFARAKEAGIKKGDLLDIEDHYIARPGKLSNPGAARAYWEKAIRDHVTQERLSELRNDFMRLDNWQDALPVSNRLIKEYPEKSTDAYYWRARINEKLGRIPEARDDYRVAAAMGHDIALQALITAHLKGGLALKEKSFDTIVELCRYGATLGSGVGSNCIGSLFFEGGSAGVPYPNNPAQAIAWHLLGARAGHYNSQHDLGWILYTGRGGSVESETAKRTGIFWMRRAAEQGHHFAKLKLEENNISLSEEPSVQPLFPALIEWIRKGI